MAPDDLHQLVALFRALPIVDALVAVEQRYREQIEHLDVWLWDHQHTVLQALRDEATIGLDGVDGLPDGMHTAPIELLGDEIGILAARTVDGAPAGPTEAFLSALTPVVALAVRANEPAVDTIPVRRRRREMALPAEMQWSVLPPTDLRTEEVTVSAAVEPAYETGGDLFDFALHDRTIFLCVLDAMGHGLRAAQVSTLAISALRRTRRNGGSLGDMADEISTTIAAAGSGAFVSAVMARFELDTGRGTWLSAGHLPPLITDASGESRALELVPTLPLGMEIGGETSSPVAQDLVIEPGESLVLYSDGIIENAAVEDHQPIGEARFLDALGLVLGADREAAARRVIDHLIELTGPALRDDATLLVARRPSPEV